MNTKDFYYNLPLELIAQTPIEPRDNSKLLVMNKYTGELTHEYFYNIINYLNRGDVLVINNTRVIPARIYGKLDNDRNVEFLLLKRLNYTNWECICKPAKKLKVGTKIYFSNNLNAKIININENGIREIEFSFDGVFENILNEIGNMPLPPYITEKLLDSERYQTVYSKIDGSAAAPTAGLHFTSTLIEKIKAKGIIIAEVLLHVGLSTFRPVKAENVEEHKMHSEYYEITKESANIINLAKKEGRLIIAVGTTSVRTLESAVNKEGYLSAKKDYTSIFIYPPYKFKIVDALITNFHLPESTLLMLVSAFADKDKVINMYNEAIKERYRFFSFGDATFIY